MGCRGTRMIKVSRSSLARVLFLALVSWFLALPQRASADDANWETVVSLAVDALNDDLSALETLKTITSIEGIPTDIGTLLEDEEKLHERLSAISQLGTTPHVDTKEVDRVIDDILNDPAFPASQKSLLDRILGPVPLFLRRVQAWTNDLARRVLIAMVGLLSSMIGFFSGEWAAIIGLLAVGILTAVAAFVLGRKRAREIERQATIRRILDMGSDPEELEKLALEAAAATTYSEAIRLWFVAGLLRLDAEGQIDFTPGVPNGVFAEKLGSPIFDRLSDGFDRVVYGKEPASRSDWTAAQSDWSSLRRDRR